MQIEQLTTNELVQALYLDQVGFCCTATAPISCGESCVLAWLALPAAPSTKLEAVAIARMRILLQHCSSSNFNDTSGESHAILPTVELLRALWAREDVLEYMRPQER
jgi:hypothetical protein